MKGKITIEASDHGYGIDCDLEDVNILGKLELMHSLATVLKMDDTDMHLYLIAEKLGILKDANTQVQCMSAEQLQSMLRGEQPEGITINMTELRRQLNES